MSVPHNIIYAVADRLGIPRGKIFDKEQQKRIWSEIKRPEFKLFRVTSDRNI